MTITNSFSPLPIETYSHDQWNKRNGKFGALIVKESKTDYLIETFREHLRGAPYVTPNDTRLALAYGYFVHKGIMTVEEAEAICGVTITEVDEQQVLSAMTIEV